VIYFCHFVETVVLAAPAKKLGSYFSEVATETAHRFALSEIEDATDKFERRIGSGGFGIVYYGKLADGREIAVKLLTNDSYQGIREFLNEVCFCFSLVYVSTASVALWQYIPFSPLKR
jgi:hypothetical protein